MTAELFPDTPPPSPPLEVNGHTYYLSFHAIKRAEQMGVPLVLVPRIIEVGRKRVSGKVTGRTDGAYYLTAGKVTLVVIPRFDDWSVISTVLWSSDNAWKAWFGDPKSRTGGRTYRKPEYASAHQN